MDHEQRLSALCIPSGARILVACRILQMPSSCGDVSNCLREALEEALLQMSNGLRQW